MSPSRYREARTLVRRLCRLPNEDRVEFRQKVARLRAHFIRFNSDTSELCQWLMGLRKQFADPIADPASFGALGNFLLEPELPDIEADEAERDRWRLAVFDAVAGFRPDARPANQPLPGPVAAAVRQAAAQQAPTNSTARRLFERLRALQPAHRLVLLKSAAEWIVARYRRGVENWIRAHEEWAKEKIEWEKRNPELPPEIRERFTAVFKGLREPGRDDVSGVRRKNPRICRHDRLRGNLDNCVYAGEKGHGLLCWKYIGFTRDQKAKRPRFEPRTFEVQAREYLEIRHGGADRQAAFSRLFPKSHHNTGQRRAADQKQQSFVVDWAAYLHGMGLDEKTVIQRGCFPHCLKLGKTFEESECRWNPHTELCNQYKRALDNPANGFDDGTLALEPLYREWRKNYLAGPRKPSFKYPSSRDLPMPKIFGEGFHEIDLERSILRLRLDDMSAGEWLEFGFIPWPRDYRPSREEIGALVTSVHIHFVGTRARAGFRFAVPHATSRLGCTQDELDELRSRRFPRQAQDQEFLEAARKRIIASFGGDAERELRILAVDLGETGAWATVYHGRSRVVDVPLRIIKIDQRYAEMPGVLKKDQNAPKPPKFEPESDPRGLRKQHVARHLERIAASESELARRRQAADRSAGASAAPSKGVKHDLRGPQRHVAWMIRDWARHNAAQVVAAAEEHGSDLIVFESLRGFRLPGYNEMDLDKKRRFGTLSFGRIRRKVVEKAVERGLRVVTVPYFLSSRFCAVCGHEQQNKGRWRRNKKDGKFACECGAPQERPAKGRSAAQEPARSARTADATGCACTSELNSDANAARVLARVFWSEIRLPAAADRARTRA